MADLATVGKVSRCGVAVVDPMNYPAAAGAVGYAGRIVALNASGNAIGLLVAASAAYAIPGVASKSFDNSAAGAAAGDVQVEVENVYYVDNDSTNPITAAHIKRSYCYVVDNHTVGSSNVGGSLPLAGVPIKLGTAGDGTAGKVAVAFGQASAYSLNPLLDLANAGDFTARGVATSIAALTFTAGSFSLDANGALGSQDGLTFVAGQTIVLPTGTITTGVVSAANSGPWVLTSAGGASAKATGIRPDWWPHGGTVPIGQAIKIAAGTLFGGTQWQSFADVSQTIGTDDPKLYPRQVTQQVTLAAGTKTISNVPIFSLARLGMVPTVRGGTPAATTTGYQIKLSSGAAAGGIGTASAIVEAQSVVGTIVNTDVTVLNVTLING